MLNEPITTYDGTGVHEHTLDELRGMDMDAFNACIHINNKYIDDFMLMPITVYPASESTVRYVDSTSKNYNKAIGLHALYPRYVLESADGDGELQYYLSYSGSWIRLLLDERKYNNNYDTGE